MKTFIYILVLLSGIGLFGQNIELNYLLIAEINTSECDVKKNVIFMSPVIKANINNMIDRHEVFQSAKEDYLFYLDNLIDTLYPEYYDQECSSDINNWKFFEEWSIGNSDKLKQSAYIKYQPAEIVKTDFSLDSRMTEKVSISTKKEIDP